MDRRTELSLKACRDQMLDQARATAKQLEMTVSAVAKALEKNDLSSAGYYAASLRPQSDRILSLLLEMRVTADTVTLLESEASKDAPSRS